ncbi:MAG TPA: hypothetical protein VMJ52_10850 [Xanthobacteraceae bacterium]|nr:hypothetical protein [Xanthobacteraceae bacterium]
MAVARSEAQAPPPAAPSPLQAPLPGTGFVSPYEIMRTVRAAGFDPLAPPLREGTTYVVRALDYRGILMRVVVDAHTGAIRDANRIVPGPGRYGQYGDQYGMIESAYGPPSVYEPEDIDVPMPGPYHEVEPTMVRPASPHDLPPPLPRPRPASLASRKGMDAGPPPAADSKPDLQSDITSSTPPPVPAAPAAPAVPKKAPPVEPIND